MGCIITYNNKKYSQLEFNEYFKSHFFEFAGDFLGSKQDIEGFKEFIQNNSQTFYNLNKLDAKRKATNNTLNGILSRALSNLSVETIDENGVVTNKTIEVKSLEAFKNWYENNPKY